MRWRDSVKGERSCADVGAHHLGELLLADAMADFCQQHPGLTVEMSLDNRFVNLVEEGFDLVIRTGYLDDSSLIARHPSTPSG